MIKTYVCLAFVFILCIFTSCKDDNEIGIGYDKYASLLSCVDMLVTNNKGEDLVLNSSGYSKTSEGVETFGFDTWEVYMNGKLIQTAKENVKYRRKRIDRFGENSSGKRNINLESDLAVDEILRKDNYLKPSEWEYVVSSKSLFGDAELHRIRMEYQPRFKTLTEPKIIEYDIYVDGEQQVVYYPESWGLESQVGFGKFVHPCFILNIDK